MLQVRDHPNIISTCNTFIPYKKSWQIFLNRIMFFNSSIYRKSSIRLITHIFFTLFSYYNRNHPIDKYRHICELNWRHLLHNLKKKTVWVLITIYNHSYISRWHVTCISDLDDKSFYYIFFLEQRKNRISYRKCDNIFCG